uniref:Uncharacterized protein n=1 Tax=Bos indicus x Bos taurus TaxID=30522 RepID=A0A4W2EVY4_BOBOX
MADIQTEHACQKQPTIFQNKKRVLLRETGKEKADSGPQEHVYWGHFHSGHLLAPEQDGALPRAQGHQGCRHQEKVPEVLTLDPLPTAPNKIVIFPVQKEKKVGDSAAAKLLSRFSHVQLCATP